MNTNESQWTSSLKNFQNRWGWKGEVPHNILNLATVGADVTKVSPGVSTVKRDPSNAWTPLTNDQFNAVSTELTGLRKSGELARHNQQRIAEGETSKYAKKDPTVKINTDPAKGK